MSKKLMEVVRLSDPQSPHGARKPAESMIPRGLSTDVDKKLDECKGLEQEVNAAAAELRKATKGLDRARIDDSKDFADALRAGKKDPGSPRQTKVRKAISDAERLLEARRRNLVAGRNELRTLIEDSKDALITKTKDELNAATATVTDLIAQLEHARRLEDMRANVAAYVESYPDKSLKAGSPLEPVKVNT